MLINLSGTDVSQFSCHFNNTLFPGCLRKLTLTIKGPICTLHDNIDKTVPYRINRHYQPTFFVSNKNKHFPSRPGNRKSFP